MPLRLTAELLTAIRAHGEASYPDEGCGVLVGRHESSHRAVAEVVAMRNVAEPVRRNRFAFDPAEHLAVQRAARERGHEIVGFFHSHPDHPAQPSATDLGNASWPGYSFVIVAVASGVAGEVNSFELAADRSRFVAELMEATDVRSG